MTASLSRGRDRKADIQGLRRILAEPRNSDNPAFEVDSRRAIGDLRLIHQRLLGRRTAHEAAHAAGRIGELVLIARAVAEDNVPLRAGRRGYSDLLAVNSGGQFVAFDAKATTSMGRNALPQSMSLSRLGLARVVDPQTGEVAIARQGSAAYTGRDAEQMTLPADAGELTPYAFLHIGFAVGTDRWGVSDWFSDAWYPSDVPDGPGLRAHQQPEAVHVTLGFDDGSFTGMLTALDTLGLDLESKLDEP